MGERYPPPGDTWNGKEARPRIHGHCAGHYGLGMRVGLVGCGRWGRFILRDLVGMGCEVTVVARTEASRARAEEGGAAAVVGSIEALPEVAGVVVATPTDTHAAVVWEVLDLGVPVFVEKPMTNDPVTAQALAGRAGDRLFVMDKWRYHPGVEKVAGLARSREHGRLLSIQTRRLSWGHNHADVDGIWILLPHDLSIVFEIAGLLPSPIGAIGSVHSRNHASLTALLGPAPTCTVEVSTASPILERRITVEFEEAVLLLDDAYAEKLRVRHKGFDTETSVPIPADLPLERELAAFVGHLRGGPPPRSSAAEGLAVVEMISTLRAMAGV
jgi:predicted dehydrogenase